MEAYHLAHYQGLFSFRSLTNVNCYFCTCDNGLSFIIMLAFLYEGEIKCLGLVCNWYPIYTFFSPPNCSPYILKPRKLQWLVIN